jgi:hypothetical protein
MARAVNGYISQTAVMWCGTVRLGYVCSDAAIVSEISSHASTDLANINYAGLTVVGS